METAVTLHICQDLVLFLLGYYTLYIHNYTYCRVAKHHEPPLQSKDLFDMFYAPKIQAEFAGTKLEPVPDPKDLPGFGSRIRNAFKRTRKEKNAEHNEPR